MRISGDWNQTHTENHVPYRFIGDNNDLNLSAGHYSIKAEVFSEAKTRGEVCDMMEVSFKICSDADQDGICDEEDCEPNDSSIPGVPGTPCNDGNDETLNDIIGEDGCTCAGECPVIEPRQDQEVTICEGESYTFEVYTNAPRAIYDRVEVVAFSTPQTNPYTSSDNYLFLRAIPIPADGEISLTADRLADLSGTQYVYACFKPNPEICLEFLEFVVNIEEDSDDDGICDDDDCAPNDPSIQGLGDPCDDG